MKKGAATDALADRAQAAPVILAGPEIELARVVETPDVTPGHRTRRGLGAAGDDPIDCHPLVAQKPPEPDFACFMTLGQTAKARRAQLHHALEHRRLPLPRRRFPKATKLPFHAAPPLPSVPVQESCIASVGEAPPFTASQFAAPSDNRVLYVP
jgi:hypothetical protein